MKSALDVRELTQSTGLGDGPRSVRISKKSTTMSKQKGFSLIELLMVVAIIATLAALSVPNLLRARIAANQASAVGSMHAIQTANVTYNATFGGYAPSLSALGGSQAVCASGTVAPVITAACLIDPSLSEAITPDTAKSGYYFTYVGSFASANGTVQRFDILASPASQNSTGELAYHADPMTWEIVPQTPIPTGATAKASTVDTGSSSQL
jgi:type IV pilus assembly protein PilA